MTSGRLTIQVSYRAETSDSDARDIHEGMGWMAQEIGRRLSTEQFRCSAVIEEQQPPKEVEMIQYHPPVFASDPDVDQLYDVQVTRSPRGLSRRTERLRDVKIVDGWKLHERLKALGMQSEAQAVLELWEVAIDFRANLANDLGGI